MLICGIKVTHDGGVAVIEDGQLRFSTEIEKLGNGERYSSLGDLERVTELLRSEGLEPADVDQFVVDGWFTGDGSEQVVSTEPSRIRTLSGGRPLELTVAPYHDQVGVGDPIARQTFRDHDFGAPGRGYASYHHVSNHLLGAYCSSPFAARGEDALVLVRDGGMAPRLYRVEAAPRTARPDRSSPAVVTSASMTSNGSMTARTGWTSRHRGARPRGEARAPTGTTPGVPPPPASSEQCAACHPSGGRRGRRPRWPTGGDCENRCPVTGAR